MHEHEKRPHAIQGPVGQKGPSGAMSRQEMLNWISRETLFSAREMDADMSDGALALFICSFPKLVLRDREPIAVSRVRPGSMLDRELKKRQKSSLNSSATGSNAKAI